MDGEVLQIVADVLCEKDRIARKVVGSHGMTIMEIAKSVNEFMQNLLGQQLFIRILVKVDGKVFDIRKDLRNLSQKRLQSAAS